MPPGAATHGNRCQTVAGRTHPWRITRQRRRHFRRGVLAAVTARRSSAALLGFCLMLCPAAALDAAPQEETPRSAVSDNTLQMAMRNVVLYPYGDVSAHVTELSATVASTRPAQPVVMDDVASYEV